MKSTIELTTYYCFYYTIYFSLLSSLSPPSVIFIILITCMMYV